MASPHRRWRAPSLVAALALAVPLLAVPAWSAAERTDLVTAATTPVVHEITAVRVAAGGADPLDESELVTLVDRVDGPVAGYWAEQTDGAVQFEATAWPDPVTTAAPCSDTAAMYQQAAQTVGWQPGPGKHLLLYVSSRGVGSWPCDQEDGQRGATVHAGGIAYTRGASTKQLAHVLGHNLGLEHQSLRRCSARPDEEPCDHQDSRDLYDVMSQSVSCCLGSLSAPQARLLGLVPATATVTVGQGGPGTKVRLAPISGRGGVRVLRLTTTLYGQAQEYWLEYRPAAGRDAWLAGTTDNDPGLEPGVLVRRAGDDRESFLLDGSPTGSSDDWRFALPVGRGVPVGSGHFVVRVAEQSATGATVTVTTDDDTPFPRDRTGRGLSDLLAVARDGTLYLYPTRVDGSLGAPRGIGRGWQSRDLLTTVGDFDGDARHDVVARDPATGELWLYSGNDTGGFRSWRVIGRGWNGVDALLSPGDWDGDGAVDLLARARRDGRLLLHPGNGIGGFRPSRPVGSGWGTMTAFATCPDWDADQAVDFLARRRDGALFLYEADGSGGFRQTRQVGSGWQVFTAVTGLGGLGVRDSGCEVLARRADGGLWRYTSSGARWDRAVRVGAGWNGFRLFG